MCVGVSGGTHTMGVDAFPSDVAAPHRKSFVVTRVFTFSARVVFSV